MTATAARTEHPPVAERQTLPRCVRCEADTRTVNAAGLCWSCAERERLEENVRRWKR